MSADHVKAQKSFCEKKNFPFALLSDESKDTIKAYGAWGLKSLWGENTKGFTDILISLMRMELLRKSIQK